MSAVLELQGASVRRGAHVVLVDISLNGPDGLDLLKSVRAHDHHLPVLILSMLDETLYAERALRAGAM